MNQTINTSNVMEKYIALLREAVPGFSRDDMDTPLRESGIHSLDTVIIRDSLERHFGFEIADDDWYRFGTISESIAFMAARSLDEQLVYCLEKADVLYRNHGISLPQMANSGLSENWLLKEMGDIHWELLSRGLEQKSSEFNDAQGNRLYAAFIRVNYSVSPLDQFIENDMLHLKGEIKRFGDFSYLSAIKGKSGDKQLKANMMTSFSARKTGDNKQIAKCASMNQRVNHIEMLKNTPDFYNQHRMLKKNMLTEVESNGYKFQICDDLLATIVHTVNPHYEINGVGLLYFAAYPIIADECTTAFMKKNLGIKNYDASYHTTHRDIFYFANCNSDEAIRVELNTLEHLEGDRVKYATSLYRESDNKLMARVFTMKQKS